MITIITILLDLPIALHSSNISSVLHGVLVQLLSSDSQSIIHGLHGYSPLKQRLMLLEGKAEWEIVVFNEDLGSEVVTILLSQPCIYLEYHKCEVKFLEKKVKLLNVSELISTTLNSNDTHRNFCLKLLTPTSFKSEDRYDIIPDVARIFRSIMLMFDDFDKTHNLFDVETLKFVKQNVHIVDYRIRSTRFHLEGVKIPAFVGEIHLRVNGPPQLVRFVKLLIIYGTFSGIGIKTSLGMGKYILK